jgi:signal transduction histidine kinase/ligand-binding sensor domain-containing protein
VNSITQTEDGYLWAGTDSGLEVYDGTHFRDWPLPGDGPVFGVHAARDGSLWIGRSGSVVNVRHGRPVPFFFENGRFNAFYEDPSGALWVARTRGPLHSGGLCKLDESTLRCFGASAGQTCDFADVITRDTAGVFWIGSLARLCKWRPGDRTLSGQKIGDARMSGVVSLLAEPDGSMLVGYAQSGEHLGLQRVTPLGTSPFTADGLNGTDLQVSALFRDRDGAVWIGTIQDGLYHVTHGKVDRFTSADGLSSNTVNAFFEDREDNVWVATAGGIDRFHMTPVSAFTTREGLSADRVHSVLARRDGSIFIGTLDGLDILRDGTINHIRADEGLPGHSVTSMLEDNTGHVWIGVDDILALYDGHTFRAIAKRDGSKFGVVVGLVEDAQRDIWVLTTGRPYQLYRIRKGEYVDEVPLPGREFPKWVAIGPDGALHVLTQEHRLYAYRAGKFSPVSLPELGTKPLKLFMLSDGAMFLVGRSGIYYVLQGRSLVLDKARGLPCGDLSSVSEIDKDTLLMRGQCGLMILPTSSLARSLSHPREKLELHLLDSVDGVRAGEASFEPAATKSADGRLWFATDGPLLTADPLHLRRNLLPPPVHVEELVADHVVYPLSKTISLPPRTRDLEIDYAGLSFVAPQKMGFRYRLIGLDDSWQDVGSRRSAFYMNLTPGSYRFQVIASNNDGVWNTAGDEIDLVIRPAYYQTIWFRACIVVSFLGFLWLALWLRIRYATAQIEARLLERQTERIRIARDLHDTLLQGFQGLLIRLQVAVDALPEPSAARHMMEAALDRAEAVLVEGRERVFFLRTTEDAGPLPCGDFASLVAELRRDEGCAIDLQIFGTPRPLRGQIQEDVYAIAKEALVNACRHSQATTIFCHLTFADGRLVLVCGDNGIGIDTETIREGRREGHWGIAGMHERARNIGAVLQITSVPGQTRIELRLNTRTTCFRELRKRLLLSMSS